MTHSEERIDAWLVGQGMDRREAAATAKNAATRSAIQKKTRDADRNADQLLGWLEIVGGVGLLIAGLVAGWFVGLFLVPIFDGFRRVAS